MKSLYDCRNHWQWLWITGSSRKRSYEPSAKWKFRCACCESTNNCEACQLVGYAWSHGCVSSKDSFYTKWLMAETKEERQYYAHKMVMACNRAIENELTNHLALKELTK